MWTVTFLFPGTNAHSNSTRWLLFTVLILTYGHLQRLVSTSLQRWYVASNLVLTDFNMTLFLFPLCSPSSIMRIKENSKMLQEYGMCMYYYENDPVCVSVCTQSCPTICDPVDYSLPGSSVHRISQAWILEWVAMPFSRRWLWWWYFAAGLGL